MLGLPPLASHLLELGLLIIISCIAIGVGQLILGFLRTGTLLSKGERLIFGLALGYGFLSFALLLLGLLRLLYLPVGLALLTFLAIVAFRPFLTLVRDMSTAIRAALNAVRYSPNLFLTVISLVTIGALLSRVLAPVTSHDDLMYHLELPHRYLEDHAVLFYPDSPYSLFPLGMEMLYTLGLLLGSDRLPALFALTVGLAGAAAAAIFAGRYLAGKKEGLWRALPLLTFVLYLTMPITAHIMRAANTDAAQATFDLLALYAFYLGLSGNQNRLFIVSGIFAGLAFSTKYYGFAIGTLIGIALVIRALMPLLRGPRREAARYASSIAAFAVPALALGGTWLVRNIISAGNPVWPFASKLFGGNYTGTTFSPEQVGWAPAGASGLAGIIDAARFTWTSIVRAPTYTDNMILVVSLGPLLLPALLAIPAIRWNSALRWFAIGAIWYWFIWAVFFLHVSIRYVETSFLVLAPVSAVALISLAESMGALKWLLSSSVAVLLAVLALDLAISSKYYLAVDLALDNKAEYAYLTEHLEEQPVLDYIGQNTPANAGIYIWDSQPRGYFIPRRYIYARSVPLYSGFGLPSEQWRARLLELDITYVLIHKRPYLAPGLPPGYDPFLDAEQDFTAKYLGDPLIAVPDFQNSEYALYELK